MVGCTFSGSAFSNPLGIASCAALGTALLPVAWLTPALLVVSVPDPVSWRLLGTFSSAFWGSISWSFWGTMELPVAWEASVP